MNLLQSSGIKVHHFESMKYEEYIILITDGEKYNLF